MVTVSPPNPESREVSSYITDLDTRMRRVEAGLRSVQLGNSSLEGGGIDMFDPFGNYRGTVGFQSDGTTALTSKNPEPPAIPSAPQVTPAIACLIVSHTGETQSGAPNPADFSHLNVYTSDAALPGVYTFCGTINPVPGEFVVSGLDYTEYLVDVTAVNFGGKESAHSSSIGGTPQQVVGADIIEGAVNDLALADGAVTEAKVAADAITTTKIADDAITSPKVIAGAIGAAEIAANSISAGHIVSRAITADKIVALSLTANEIATNAITAGKILAGSITASKLEADMVIATRIIAGSATGARVEMHPTAGLQAFNSAGLRTFIIEAATGNYFSVGQFATGFSGVRIVMNPGGGSPDTIRFYGNATQYGSIFADPAGVGVGVFMKGGFTQTGKVGVYDAEGFVTWTDHVGAETWSAFDATSNAAAVWGGEIMLDARNGYGSGDVIIRNRHYDNSINSARELKFQGMGGSSELPALFSPSHDTQIIWTDGGLIVQNAGIAGSAAYKPVIASAFTVSSRTAKKNEKDIVLHRTSTPRQGISELVPKSWHYAGEWDGTGERPPPPTWNSPEVVRDENGIAVLGEDGTTKYEDNWHTGSEVQAIKPHIGLIAEEVIEVFPELVVASDDVDGGLLLSTNDTLGMMWQALHDEIKLTDHVALKQPMGLTGGTPHGTVVDSMSVPPPAPTTGALLYENNGNLWVITSIGKRTRLT